ncbi:hypothetical protein AB0H92_44180 [Streptomyces phaeochromogenes]|uniref:Secreted protein n=1 Tax=Streptomyces phaeochromogenes TaxID=1923 RepID=A0ABZ1HD36_STRPH|nr:hypothetical protein [Streptomyces phaeochromogenes]MCX5601973.1 hypothetical protein [Streptomyces phaeochromogenes]WRZ29752.1 hypothetical protein OG931_19305 [Streptomyces phaeochromogenes]WSD15482.1 hypothetical protein OHB35_20720 [Streptomyces phaeochromogenes]WSW17082.1 hypothetical protein OG277_31190 [Streptomyces phaeochromogenes]WTA04521.1 hypothetical protein OHB08_20445 [Streptomyces phaeochromogenes]
MARFPAYQNPTARRALLALTTAGIAVGVGATSAAADTEPVVDVVRTRPTSLGNIDPQSGVQALTGTVGYVTGPVAGLKPNPLAGTGVDPLDNGLATQVADFPPLATTMLTAPVAQAQSLGAVPVLGQVTGLLH